MVCWKSQQSLSHGSVSTTPSSSVLTDLAASEASTPTKLSYKKPVRGELEESTDWRNIKMKAAVLCFLLMAVAVALATFTKNDSCIRTCGNTSVPFPFGLEESCAWNSNLVLSCNHTSGIGNLILGKNIPVYNIFVENGTMATGMYGALDCYDARGVRLNRSKPHPAIRVSASGHYTLSDTRNKLTVLGCDTVARISDTKGSFGSGCFSYCRDDIINFTAERACSGLGCCQTSIPKSLRSLHISMSSTTNYTSVDFTYCGSAFIVDEESFNISDYKLPDRDDIGKSVFSRIVLDWVIERGLTCEEAKLNRTSFACNANSLCSDFRNGDGYRCSCKAGYTGNPYGSLVPPGCQDIDECKDPQQYPCHGKCKNTAGSYTCKCPFGMTGDGKVDCQISHLTIIAAVVALPIFGVTSVALVIDTWRRRSKQKNFRRNGGELLKHRRIQFFTEAELAKATNNYDESNKLGEGGFGSVYRGRIAGDAVVAVKKPKDVHKSLVRGDFQHELEIVMQINHKNVVKLHGICLETRIPLLVYEYISNGTLFQHIHQNASTILRSWKNRLKIAAEAALALEYMHSCAEPPIIHGDIKSVNILLDQNYSVKVSDFGTSVLISPQKSHIVASEIQGTLGYIDPEYLTTGMLTIKSDVYSFGAVLVELLTGKKPTSFIAESGEPINIIHYFISCVKEKKLSDVISFESASKDDMERVGMVAEIAVKCLDQSGARRPAMREVAEQLARIDCKLDSWTVEKDNEETEREVDEEKLPSHSISVTCETSQHGTTSGSLF